MIRDVKSLGLIFAAVVALVFWGGPDTAFAQSVPVPEPVAPSGRLVKLNVIVTDEKNHSLDDIGKEELQVFEDGTQQKIVLLEKDDRPIDYAIVVDNSGSLRFLFSAIQAVVTLFIDNKRQGDEIMIERFISSDKISTLQDFTGDKALLHAARTKMRLEGGQSAVIDGLYLAIDHIAKLQRPDRRKAVILITDGEDRASFYTGASLVKLLHKTNVQVFIIGLVMDLDKQVGLTRSSQRERAEKLLSVIAKEGHGRLFLPTTVGELEVTASEIIHDLQQQFVVGYHSTNLDRNPGFRKVEVKIIDEPKARKRKVIAPRGYEVGAPGSN